MLTAARSAVASGASAGSTSIAIDAGTSWITHQRIGVGRKSHGDLVVVSKAPLGHVDQVLLGHVNSLLALDFEKPARLRQAQQQLNSHARLLLGGEQDLTPAWASLAQVADSGRQIRALVIECETKSAMNGRAAVTDAVEKAVTRSFCTPRSG